MDWVIESVVNDAIEGKETVVQEAGLVRYCEHLSN